MAMNLSKELKGSLRRRVMKEQLCGIDNGKDSIIVLELYTTEDMRIRPCSAVKISFNQNDYPYITNELVGSKIETIDNVHTMGKYPYSKYKIRFKDTFDDYINSIQESICTFEYLTYIPKRDTLGHLGTTFNVNLEKKIKIKDLEDNSKTNYKFKLSSHISENEGHPEIKDPLFIYVIFTNVFNCPIIRISNENLDVKDAIDLYSSHKFIYDSYTEPINQTKEVITTLTGKPASAKMIAEGRYTNSCAGKENITVDDNNIITRYSNPFTHISFVKKDISEEVNIEETTYEIDGKKLYLKYRWYNKYTHDEITYNISDLAIRVSDSVSCILYRFDIDDICQEDDQINIERLKSADPALKNALAEILNLIKENTKFKYENFIYSLEIDEQKLAEVMSTQIRSIKTTKLFDNNGSVIGESNYSYNNWTFASTASNINIRCSLFSVSPSYNMNYIDNDLYIQFTSYGKGLHKTDQEKRIIYLGENDKINGYSFGGDKNSLEEKNLVLIRDEFGVPTIYTLEKFTK